jgi:hypothetical protein
MPEDKDKSLSLEVALLDAVGLLHARVDALESLMDEFLSVLDRPLSPTESLVELRHLKEAIDAQTPQGGGMDVRSGTTGIPPRQDSPQDGQSSNPRGGKI